MDQQGVSRRDESMARRVEPVRDIRGAGRRIRVLRRAMILLAALWAARMSGAAVYDPSRRELFTAERGGGAFLKKSSVKPHLR